MRTANAIPERTIDLAKQCLAVIAPPPKLTISEWADANVILPEGSAFPGSWRTSRTPYGREIMDACAGGRHRRIVMMMASQLIKTAAMLNVLGYHIDIDPCRIMMVMDSLDEARKFSKDRIEPMRELMPCLRNKISDVKNDPTNTTLRKEYPGGVLTMVGANAPRGLASIFNRIVFFDEVDGYPPSAGVEGDPILLAEKRQTTFWNALSVLASTPTVKGESRIEKEYENSTREQWCVPCPSCGELQPFEWARIIFNRDPSTSSGCIDVPETSGPEMACRACGSVHNEWQWKAGSEQGRWIARQEHANTRGFHLNALASPFISWAELVEEFLDAKRKGQETLKTFVNTRLAETWEEAGDVIQDDMLAQRRHIYGCDVPEAVTWLTCGCDVQKDRIEFEVVGWGPGKESWGIEYGIIHGDPQDTAVWNDLDEQLQRTYKREDGALLPICCTAIDSGYATSSVYAFTKRRYRQYVFAVDGQGGPGRAVVNAVRKLGKNKDTYVFPVGSDAGKDLLMTRLSLDDEGPGYCHFPREMQMADGTLRGYTDEYFKGLTSEKRVQKYTAGRMYHIWKKPGSWTRNEPLDCRVYATAALEIRNPDLNFDSSGSRAPKQVVITAARRRRMLSTGVD